MSRFLFFGILLNIVCSSFSFNLSTDLQKVAIPELYAQHLNEYLDDVQSFRNLTLCEHHVLYYLEELKSGELWALKMFDAGTKIPSGFLRGLSGDYGSFDECLSIKTNISNSFLYGKYCLGLVPVTVATSGSTGATTVAQKNNVESLQPRIPNLDGDAGYYFATCFPDTCSSQEIQNIYSLSGLLNINVQDKFCHSVPTKPKFTGSDIAAISFLSVIFAIMILSTAYDTYLFYTKKKSKHILLIAFSVLTNGRKLLTITKSPNQLTYIHGLRVISMMWVLLGHRVTILLLHPLRNLVDAALWFNDEGNMYIFGATVSVDTFLVLSGLMVSYVFMLAMSKGIKFNIVMFYVHRYLRLTPLFAVVMVLYMTLLIHLGSGPYWKSDMQYLSRSCESTWWSALLYVQNYLIDYHQGLICIQQSWYLSVDTQLYIIAPAILFLLKNWPTIGSAVIITLTGLTMIASFMTSYAYKLKGLIVANPAKEFMLYYYTATHTRAGPWFMGLLLGYYIFKHREKKRKVVINKFLVLAIWIVVLGVLAACVFTGHNTIKDPFDRVGNAFYVALLRPGWGLAICAVILLCELGYGGPISWFLSLPVFEVLSRLTYSMYLIHMAMQVVVIAQSRNVTHFSSLSMLHGYWGDYIFTVGAATILTLAFESPIISLEKVLFGRVEKKNVNDNANN